MTGDQIAQFAYLALLGTAVGGWMLLQGRRNLGKTAQQAAVWGMIFLGAIAAAGLWGDIRGDIAPQQSVVSEQSVEVPRRFDGHYYLTLEVDGTPVQFVVDTGATGIVLSKSDAKRIGIDADNLAYLGSAGTANGMVRTASVTLDSLRLGPIEDHDVRAFVNAGELDGSLLGMDYLNRFRHIEISGDKMVLTR